MAAIVIFLAIGIGFILAALQYRGVFLDFGVDAQIVEHWCNGWGRDDVFNVFKHGYFYAFPNWLGHSLSLIGIVHPTLFLHVLNICAWIAQLAFCYRIANKLVGPKSAVIACAMYGWGMTITDIVDINSYLVPGLARCLGLTGTLAGLALWFEGKKTWAYIVELLTLYVHADPAVTILTYFIFFDVFYLKESWKRIAMTAIGASPLAIYEMTAGHFPPALAEIALLPQGLEVFPYSKVVYLRALCGILIFFWSWRKLNFKAHTELLPWMSASIFLVPWTLLLRASGWHQQFLLQVTSGNTWLWPLEFFGRIVIAGAVVDSASIATLAIVLAATNLRPAYEQIKQIPYEPRKEDAPGLLADLGTASIPMLESFFQEPKEVAINAEY